MSRAKPARAQWSCITSIFSFLPGTRRGRPRWMMRKRAYRSSGTQIHTIVLPTYNGSANEAGWRGWRYGEPIGAATVFASIPSLSSLVLHCSSPVPVTGQLPTRRTKALLIRDLTLRAECRPCTRTHANARMRAHTHAHTHTMPQQDVGGSKTARKGRAQR